jgi:GMP synthase-like glutamine amidotransferase
MRVAILQHESGEHAGYFETVFQKRGVEYITLPLYETQEVPSLHETHLLIMGGSMSVHDEQEFPFLRDEKLLIREQVRRKHPVLGICLGAQLIADAFGARVYPYRKERGWTTLSLAPSVPSSIFPPQFHAFQLHDDTFEIPEGGSLFCTGKEVRNQAFLLGSACGLQFHVEMTKALIGDWIRDWSETEKRQIWDDTAQFLSSSNLLCRKIVESFLCQGCDANS